MDSFSKEKYEARAKIIKALAHPTRLFIVDELSGGAGCCDAGPGPERCVCELTEKIGADISTVSKHLSILKNAGIVTDEKRGLQVFYRLNIPCVLKFFGCVEEVIRTAAEKQLEITAAR